jgi:hypothetical protein
MYWSPDPGVGRTPHATFEPIVGRSRGSELVISDDAGNFPLSLTDVRRSFRSKLTQSTAAGVTD